MREKLEKIEMFVGNIDSFFHQKPYRCLLGSFIVGSILTAAVGLHFEHQRKAHAASHMTAPEAATLPPGPGAASGTKFDGLPPGTTPVPAPLSDDNAASDRADLETPE